MQLIRRNEEISLLYERIRIQTSTLKKGEQQYRARRRDINLIQRSIGDLTSEATTLKGSVGSLETLRNEVYQLQRELLQERRTRPGSAGLPRWTPRIALASTAGRRGAPPNSAESRRLLTMPRRPKARRAGRRRRTCTASSWRHPVMAQLKHCFRRGSVDTL